MDRRTFLASAGAAALAGGRAPATRPPETRTRWVVRESEGFDLLSFLSPLSGDPFYADHYREALAEFAPRMPAEAMAALQALKARAEGARVLLSPFLDVRFSAGSDATIADILHSIDHADQVLRPVLAASIYREAVEEQHWREFLAAMPTLRQIVVAVRDAGFSEFRTRWFAPKAATRMPALRERLAGIDIIAEVERFTGRTLEPTVEVVLLEFCKPHGIKVLGQRFLSAIDWRDDTVIRTAGHELLHPPIEMEGAAARAALAVLRRDPLIPRIVAEHDPAFGYNSLDGLLDEDLASAVDQIIAERLGWARPAAERWTEVDDGMHVLGAGLYGLMHDSGFARAGGNLEAWLADMVAQGRLAPESLHASAARVLGRPADALWPVPTAG